MVRKLVISVICAVAAVAAVAQDAQPFEPLFVDGKSWKIQYLNFIHPERNGFITYTVSGDTIVAGQECKRLAVHAENGRFQDYCFAVYEEDGKSFIDLYDAEHFSQLFDFTVKKGDVVEQKDEWTIYESWTVSSIEEIEIRNYKRRKIVLAHSKYPSWDTYWIEGIGTVDLFDMMTPFPIATDGSEYYFIECSQNGDVILNREDLGLLPPWASVESVAIEDAQGEGMIFDIHGRRVEHPQRGHIYIRDGRKFVQR